MKSKYYTPTIEEFHIGFEYEWLNENNKWIKEVTPIEISKKGFEEQTYGLRVKYLDKEDIESLGFKYKGKAIDLFFNKEGLSLRDDGYHINNIKLQYGLHDKRLKIIFCFISGEENTMFEGIINNKSEFKRLMKQLKIE